MTGNRHIFYFGLITSYRNKNYIKFTSEILRHPFMTKDGASSYRKGSKNFDDTSMDSGRGTMATLNSVSSRASNPSKPRPFPAFPIESQITEDEEHHFSKKYTSTSQEEKEPFNLFGQRGGAPVNSNPHMRHPPSPPVRLRDRYKSIFIVYRIN